MFWSKKKSETTKKKPPNGLQAHNGGKPAGQTGSNRGNNEASRRIREEALANARAARAAIGEETLDRIAAAMTRKQKTALEQAKSRIHQSDADRVASEILALLDED